jgi:hypothetical protein
LKSNGIGLAMGRIRRTRELTPSTGSGLVTVCNEIKRSQPSAAPTLIPVGAAEGCDLLI